MKISSEKREVIIQRKNQLAEIKEILKSEFIGIDDVIDNVLDSFEPWFIFPEYVTKPIVINLWGMTGTGKTTLVKRLVELADLADRMIHIDMAEYNDRYHSSLKTFITDGIVLDGEPMIFCLDEFQFARTVDENSIEMDKQGTRIIWEFIDTGKIVINTSDINSYYEISRLCSALKDCQRLGLEVKNGEVLKKKKLFIQTLEDYYLNYSRRVGYKQHEDKVQLVSENYFENIYEFVEEKYKSRRDFKEFLTRLDLLGTITFLDEILKVNKISKTLDFSSALIIVIGNLDEAYQISDDIDPEKDPDSFHRYSKQISLSAIKGALLKRFRHEQVSRLGNNHIIYPAFSSDNFRSLIKKELEKAQIKFNTNFGLEVEFTQNVNDMLFKESVFPTEGARPIITSINLQIESYFSKIINDVCLYYDMIDKVVWDYSNENHIIEYYYREDKIAEHKYKVQLKVENARKKKNPDWDAMISVHECGHAVITALTTRILPKKVSCVSANSEDGGRMTMNMPDNVIWTKRFIMDNIMIDLGGYLAERIVFGEDNLSSGVKLDLESATKWAMKSIKYYGMGSEPITITVSSKKTNEYFFTKDHHQKEAMNLIKDCKAKTEQLLLDNKEFLLELSKELTRKLSLNANDVEVFAKKYAKEEWVNQTGFIDKEKYYNFNEILFGKAE